MAAPGILVPLVQVRILTSQPETITKLFIHMKKWTNKEVSALSASVAELGYSKGIRAFIASAENENGRSFAGCEYMIRKQAGKTDTPEMEPADVPIVETKENLDDDSTPRKGWGGLISRLRKVLFGM